jgi:hypothetical protein
MMMQRRLLQALGMVLGHLSPRDLYASVRVSPVQNYLLLFSWIDMELQAHVFQNLFWVEVWGGEGLGRKKPYSPFSDDFRSHCAGNSCVVTINNMAVPVLLQIH